MENHPLAHTLAQLKEHLTSHTIHDSILPLLAHLDAQLPILLHQHSTLQREITQKNIQNKQLSKQLRKTHSKLTKKEEQCDNMNNELQRVSAIYSQKIQKLTKLNYSHDAHEVPQHLPSKRSRKDTLRHVDIQCQILSQETINRLTQQNNILRDKLEQTQKLLMQEKLLNRDLSLRLQVFNVLHEQETDELKDNSTLDAESIRGDPFQQEGMPTDLSVVDEEEEEGSSSEEEEEVGGALESWSSWLWRGSMGLIKRMTSKR